MVIGRNRVEHEGSSVLAFAGAMYHLSKLGFEEQGRLLRSFEARLALARDSYERRFFRLSESEVEQLREAVREGSVA